MIEKEEIDYIVYGFVEIEESIEKIYLLKSQHHSPLTVKSNKLFNDKQVRMIVVIENSNSWLKIKNSLNWEVNYRCWKREKNGIVNRLKEIYVKYRLVKEN